MLQHCCLLGGKAETIAGAVLGKACFLLYTIVLTPGDYSGDESNQRELNFPFLAYTIRAICQGQAVPLPSKLLNRDRVATERTLRSDLRFGPKLANMAGKPSHPPDALDFAETLEEIKS